MIFLSHSDRDKERLWRLVKRLEARGVEVWFAPKDIELGESIIEQMNDALRRAERLLIAWSRDASESQHVLDELHSFYKAKPHPGLILFMRLDETKVPTLFGDRLYFRPMGDDEHDAAVIDDWAAGQRNSEVLCEGRAPTPPQASHPLYDFPLGPMVELHRVSGTLIRAFASLLDNRAAAHTLIQEANRFRLEADPGDPGVTILGLEYLPAFEVGAYSFWTSTLYEACRHGPRMLAALLLTQPDTQFTPEARRDRAELLDHLRAKKSAGL